MPSPSHKSPTRAGNPDGGKIKDLTMLARVLSLENKGKALNFNKARL